MLCRKSTGDESQVVEIYVGPPALNIDIIVNPDTNIV
jgi:hypothetical protein